MMILFRIIFFTNNNNAKKCQLLFYYQQFVRARGIMAVGCFNACPIDIQPRLYARYSRGGNLPKNFVGG